jgi:alkaline phosphatase D
MPVRASVLTKALAGVASGAEYRLYAQQRFGRLANIVMLDDRQYRDAQICNPEGKLGSTNVNPAACTAWNDPARTLLGAAQEQWLDGAFAASGGGWTVLGQQTLFGQRAFKTAGGNVFWNDGWDGYTAARTRLTQSLQRHKVANPVLLGGDVHENWVGHVKADYSRPDSATLGVEFCGTSITSRSAGNKNIAERVAGNPHFVFADSEGKGYGVVEFTPSRLTTTLRVVDDVTRRDTKISTLRSFVVEAGRPQVLPA